MENFTCPSCGTQSDRVALYEFESLAEECCWTEQLVSLLDEREPEWIKIECPKCGEDLEAFCSDLGLLKPSSRKESDFWRRFVDEPLFSVTGLEFLLFAGVLATLLWRWTAV